MSVYSYLRIFYLIVINIITLVFYIKEARVPSSRLSALALILLPIAGGSLGACIGNFFCNTEYRELRYWLQKPIAFIPPVAFMVQAILIIVSIGASDIVSFLWRSAFNKAGLFGLYLLIVNILGFVLVIIRKLSRYIAPFGNHLIPDIILIPVLIFGGATGGVIAKVLFNFKEDWSCNSTKTFQNFIYNTGMFIISILHIGLYFFFFYIK